MAVDQTWFHRKFDTLATSDSREEILSEIQVALCGLSPTDLKELGNTVRFDSVFDSVNTSSPTQLELACDILHKLLPALEPSKVLTQYAPYIRNTLGHPSARPKEVILQELNNVTDHPEMIEQLCRDNDLIVAVIHCIADNMSVAQPAISVLTKLGGHPVGLNVMYNGSNLPALKESMTKGDVFRFRIYEVVVNVSIKSPEGLQASVASEILPALLRELKQGDVLITLNALELLTRLALNPNGLVFLDQNGVLDELAAYLDSIQDNPLEAILLPGIVKFFGNIAQKRPEDFISRFPRFVTVVGDTVRSDDTTHVAIAMETIGYIASTLNGKYALQKSGEAVPCAIRSVIERMSSLPTDVKVRVLNSLANILYLETADINNQSEDLTQSWAKALHKQPMDYILSVIKQPFPEIRLAGFKLLQCVAPQSWAQEAIINTPGLIEMLLDRSTESFKECIVAKFEVTKELVRSPTTPSNFGPEIFQRMLKFVTDGEFYVRGETEVAIEGSS